MKRPTIVLAASLFGMLAVGWMVGRYVAVPVGPANLQTRTIDPRVWQTMNPQRSGSALAPLPDAELDRLRMSDAVSNKPLPDIEYFPDAIKPVGASASVPVALTSDDLSVDQQRVWDESLSHLEPRDALEIQRLRTQLGSVAATALGLGQLEPIGAEPGVLNLPNDGSVKPAGIVDSMVVPASAVSSAVSMAPSVDQCPGFKRAIQIQIGTGTAARREQRIDLNQGVISVTSNPFDVAIDGEGWLVVQMAVDTEKLLTRCGLLTTDDQSQLAVKTTHGAMAIVPNLKLPPRLQRLLIQSDGTCEAWCEDKTEPVAIGRLQLGNCAHPSQLTVRDDGLYAPNSESGEIWQAIPGERGLGTFKQAALEQSNAVLR